MDQMRPEFSRFFDPQYGMDVVKIKPGEFFATNNACIISTVLGSCVSACIRDRVRGGGGMNHFMLPVQGVISARADAGLSLNYGAYAMERLIDVFIARGSHRDDLEVKVFGGASVMMYTSTHVGDDNAAFVINYLDTEGIVPAASDLGGSHPRKLFFFVETGRVLVKYLLRLTNDTIQARELEYAEQLRAAAEDSEFALSSGRI